MRREHAPFRVYASVKDSFEDYVRFIQGNARYHDALRAGEDSEGGGARVSAHALSQPLLPLSPSPSSPLALQNGSMNH